MSEMVCGMPTPYVLPTKKERKIKMNKLMITVVVGITALGAAAQTAAQVPVPVAVPAPVASAALSVVPVPVASISAPDVAEFQPGALCRVYAINVKDPFNSGACIEQISSAITSGTPTVDVGYDDKSTSFTAESIARHIHSVATWDGVFNAPVGGSFTITVTSLGLPYCVTINGESIIGSGQNTKTVTFKKGVNKISIVRLLDPSALRGGGRFVGIRYDVKVFTIEYRLSTSTKPAKKLLPNMLKHIVEDDPEGDWSIQ